MPNPEQRWPVTLVRRGSRPNSDRPDYRWWQELPDDEIAQHVQAVGYEVVSVVPASLYEQEKARAERYRAALEELRYKVRFEIDVLRSYEDGGPHPMLQKFASEVADAMEENFLLSEEEG